MRHRRQKREDAANFMLELIRSQKRYHREQTTLDDYNWQRQLIEEIEDMEVD